MAGLEARYRAASAELASLQESVSAAEKRLSAASGLVSGLSGSEEAQWTAELAKTQTQLSNLPGDAAMIAASLVYLSSLASSDQRAALLSSWAADLTSHGVPVTSGFNLTDALMISDATLSAWGAQGLPICANTAANAALSGGLSAPGLSASGALLTMASLQLHQPVLLLDACAIAGPWLKEKEAARGTSLAILSRPSFDTGASAGAFTSAARVEGKPAIAPATASSATVTSFDTLAAAYSSSLSPQQLQVVKQAVQAGRGLLLELEEADLAGPAVHPLLSQLIDASFPSPKARAAAATSRDSTSSISAGVDLSGLQSPLPTPVITSGSGTTHQQQQPQTLHRLLTLPDGSVVPIDSSFRLFISLRSLASNSAAAPELSVSGQLRAVVSRCGGASLSFHPSQQELEEALLTSLVAEHGPAGTGAGGASAASAGVAGKPKPVGSSTSSGRLLRGTTGKAGPSGTDVALDASVAAAEAAIKEARLVLLTSLDGVGRSGDNATPPLLSDANRLKAVIDAHEQLQQAQRRLESLQKSRADAAALREAYRPAAARAAVLLTALQSGGISHLCPSYPYASLASFTSLLRRVCGGGGCSGAGGAKKVTTLEGRVRGLVASLTKEVYDVTAAGVFEQHRLALALYLTLAIGQAEGRVTAAEAQFLSRRAVRDDAAASSDISSSGTSPPRPDWLAPSRWADALALAATGHPTLATLPVLISGSSSGGGSGAASAWREWTQHASPETAPLPSAASSSSSSAAASSDDTAVSEGQQQLRLALPPVHRLMLIRALRPDRFAAAAAGYIACEMGESFFLPQQQRPSSASSSLSSSSYAAVTSSLCSPGRERVAYKAAVAAHAGPGTPILLLQQRPESSTSPSSGSNEVCDPLPGVLSVGASLGFSAAGGHASKQLRVCPLGGQGQGGAALELVAQAASRGWWAVLTHCHTAPPALLSELDRLLTSLASKAHADFRLWLLSEPSPSLPPSLMQRSTVLVVQQPASIREGMVACLSRLSQSDLDACAHPAFRPLLWTLAWLHSVLLFRRHCLSAADPVMFAALICSPRYTEFLAAAAGMGAVLNSAAGNGGINNSGTSSAVPWQAVRSLIVDVYYGGRCATSRSNQSALSSFLSDSSVSGGISTSDDSSKAVLQTYVDEYFGEWLLQGIQSDVFNPTSPAHTGDTQRFFFSRAGHDYGLPDDISTASLEQLLLSAEALPVHSSPAVIGLAAAATDHAVLMQSSRNLLAALATMHYCDSTSSCMDGTSLTARVHSVLAHLPQPFDTDPVQSQRSGLGSGFSNSNDGGGSSAAAGFHQPRASHSDTDANLAASRSSPLTEALLHELRSFNRLLSVVSADLGRLKEGAAAASSADKRCSSQLVAKMIGDLLDGNVPPAWQQLQPAAAGDDGSGSLSAWLVHLNARRQQYDVWITAAATSSADSDSSTSGVGGSSRNSLPSPLWLGGLAAPRRLLSALVADACQRNGWALDAAHLSASIAPAGAAETPSGAGSSINVIYLRGLKLAGAGWDVAAGGRLTPLEQERQQMPSSSDAAPSTTDRSMSNGSVAFISDLTVLVRLHVEVAGSSSSSSREAIRWQQGMWNQQQNMFFAPVYCTDSGLSSLPSDFDDAGAVAPAHSERSFSSQQQQQRWESAAALLPLFRLPLPSSPSMHTNEWTLARVSVRL